MEISEEERRYILEVSKAVRNSCDISILDALNIFFALTATVGNIMILATLCMQCSLQTPSKILFRSLALADVFVGILSGPLYVILVLTIQYERWESVPFYNSLMVSLAAGMSMGLLSLFTLTAISVDRLLALVLGLRYRQVETSKQVYIVVISFWAINIGLAIPAFSIFEFIRFYAILSGLLCLAVSTLCYAMVYQKLRQSRIRVQGHISKGQSNRVQLVKMAQYRKTVCCALWVQFTLLPSTGGLALMSINLTPTVWLAWLILGTLVFVNSTLNPILYCWRIKGLRRAVVKIVRQMFCLAF